MAGINFRAKTPLIGMSMVFLAMGIVAVTAYLHAGWWSILGYAIAAAVAAASSSSSFCGHGELVLHRPSSGSFVSMRASSSARRPRSSPVGCTS